MRLGQARRHTAVAPALPMPYPALEQFGLKIRPGQTSLTIAAPATGKSQLWANLAHRMRVPTVYWSADTDQTDVTLRTLAMHTGFTIAEVEAKLADPAWSNWMYEQLGDKADHVEWVFDSEIKGPLLRERLMAYATVHGEFPALAVLDNMSNGIQSRDNEYAEVQDMLTRAQKIAREFHTHIAVLGHAKGAYEDGNKPIPKGGGAQNPFKTPEVGITLYRPDGDNRLAVNVVKNRGGRDDPGANHPVSLPIDFSRASVLGFRTAKETG